MAPPTTPPTATIRVDGRHHEVDPGRNLLEVCLGLGYDLPYFCWHPELGSVGACRQCAVKRFEDEDDEHGEIVMACMTPAADGTLLSLWDADARDFRARVVEWLMANHPHDCPVCDEGGECHLQDMTVMTGHTYREFRFDKRSYRNQDLGPLVNHEMNRCIQCYRCVRFYDDHAGGTDLQALAAHDHVYFGRHEDGPLESVFSGNLVEVCPTGVFTDKTLKRHYTRKWDLATAPSVCQQCGLGCNTLPGERSGEVRRVRSRYHGEVNGYFLCDRGRYGYEFVNHQRRLRRALAPRGPEEGALPLEAGEALGRAGEMVGGEDRRVLGIGSPRASVEANWALRTLVGEERFFRGVSAREAALVDRAVELLRSPRIRIPSLRETGEADAVLVLGEDVTHTAPMLALSLRQALRTAPLRKARALDIPLWHDQALREVEALEAASPLWVATSVETELDREARAAIRATPEGIAELGFAVAEAILEDPAPGEDPQGDGRVRAMASALLEAERPLVVSGTSLGSEDVLRAAGAVARALASARDRPADLFLTVPEADSVGLALVGGPPLEEALEAVEEGRADALVVLENDLTRRAPARRVLEALARVPVMVVDHLAHPTAAHADLVLPAATFAEADGTSVNNEGRAQRFVRVMEPQAPVRASWRWLRDVARAAGRADPGWERTAEVTRAAGQAVPALAGAEKAVPHGHRRLPDAPVPRHPHRYSGRTALHAHRDVREPEPPEDRDAPYSFSMEGLPGRPPAEMAPRFWLPGWNSVQALNRFQEEIAGPLRDGGGGVRLLDGNGGRSAPAGPDAASGAEDDATDTADDAASTAGAQAADTGAPDSWRAVPLHHCLGSDWISALSPGVAELAPDAYLALGPDDARALELDDGDRLEMEADALRVVLPLRVRPGIPRGSVGVPWGLPGLAGGTRADRVRLERAGDVLAPPDQGGHP